MLRRPISAKSWRIVVSGGSRNAVSGRSSKPTTLNVPRNGSAGRVEGVEDADGHLVVAAEDGGHRPVGDVDLSPARYPDVALQSPVRA